MKTIIRYTFALSLIGFPFILQAQQTPQFAQYFDNLQQSNAAYTAVKEVMNATLIHREQWVGFDGRPRTTSFTFQSPTKYRSVALGGSVVNDMTGPVTDTRVSADFAYTLLLQGARKLTFGVSAMGNFLNVRSSSINTTMENDPAFIEMVNNRFIPNVGFGAIYRSNNWITGFSMPRLIENSYRKNNVTSLQKRHFDLLGGKVFDFSRAFKMRAMSQMRLVYGAPFELTLSGTAIFYDQLYTGLLYRFDSAVGAFVQYQIADAFKAGIATEYSTQDIRGYNFGTFELMLSYDFPYGKKVIRAPRYF